MAGLVSDSEQDDIDYMHPNGKPLPITGIAAVDARPSWKDLRIAEQEADGHYMPRRDPYLQELKESRELNNELGTNRKGVQKRTDLNAP